MSNFIKIDGKLINTDLIATVCFDREDKSSSDWMASHSLAM